MRVRYTAGRLMSDLESLKTNLAANVKALRAAHKWTQEELAERCGLSTRAIIAIENEQVFAREVVLLRLAKELSSTVPALLTDQKGAPVELVAHVDEDAFEALQRILELPKDLLLKLSRVPSHARMDDLHAAIESAIREKPAPKAKPTKKGT